MPRYVSGEEINKIGTVYYINQKESVSDLKKGQPGERTSAGIRPLVHIMSAVTLPHHPCVLTQSCFTRAQISQLQGTSAGNLHLEETWCQCLWHNTHRHIKTQHWHAIAVPFQVVERYLTQQWDFLLSSSVAGLSVHCFLIGATRIGKHTNIWRSLSPVFLVGKHIPVMNTTRHSVPVSKERQSLSRCCFKASKQFHLKDHDYVQLLIWRWAKIAIKNSQWLIAMIGERSFPEIVCI